MASVEIDRLRLVGKDIRYFIFYVTTAIAITYLLYCQIGFYAGIYAFIFLLAEVVRFTVVHVVSWAFRDDLDILSSVPFDERGRGYRTLVCPQCHGIRAYFGMIRQREDDMDSCSCR